MISNRCDTTFLELMPLLSESISLGKSVTFTANGQSMHPYIRGGKHRVTISPITDPIQKNDVVFYQRKNGVFVLHRVIRVHSDGSLTFCGDRQFSLEEGIEPSQCIAKLTAVERNGKSHSPRSFFSRCWCFFLPVLRFTYRIGSKIKHFL